MNLSVGIPIYNESERIIHCLDRLRLSLAPFNAHLYLCFNGCSDDSREKTVQWLKKNTWTTYALLESEKGKTRAQNAIVSQIRQDGNGGDPVLFLDADVWPEQDCVSIMYKQLFRIKRLLAVGALTVPEPMRGGFTPLILNVRNLYPMSEICTLDVSDYKWYAEAYPQEGVDPEWERKSKIFFHGRCFMLKRADLFSLQGDMRVSDDTYLPNMLHLCHGPGVIRNIFSAKVYYKPYDSIVQHWLTYWRIYNDKRYLDAKYPMFHESRQHERTMLDASYIKTLPWQARISFAFYRFISRLECLSYRLLPGVDARKLWKYRRK